MDKEVVSKEYVEYENAEKFCSDTDKLATCGNKSTTCSEERQQLWESGAGRNEIRGGRSQCWEGAFVARGMLLHSAAWRVGN